MSMTYPKISLPAPSLPSTSKRRLTSSLADIHRSDVTSTDPFIPPSWQFQKKTNSRLLARSSATSSLLQESQVVPFPTIMTFLDPILRRLSTRTFSWGKFPRTCLQKNLKNTSPSTEKSSPWKSLSTQTTPLVATGSCASKRRQLQSLPSQPATRLRRTRQSNTSQETSATSEEFTTTSTPRISHKDSQRLMSKLCLRSMEELRVSSMKWMRRVPMPSSATMLRTRAIVSTDQSVLRLLLTSFITLTKSMVSSSERRSFTLKKLSKRATAKLKESGRLLSIRTRRRDATCTSKVSTRTPLKRISVPSF